MGEEHPLEVGDGGAPRDVGASRHGDRDRLRREEGDRDRRLENERHCAGGTDGDREVPAAERRGPEEEVSRPVPRAFDRGVRQESRRLDRGQVLRGEPGFRRRARMFAMRKGGR